MRLDNALESIWFPTIPDNLKDRITVAATCELTDCDVANFGYALQAISLELERTPTDQGTSATIMIIDKDSFSVSYAESESQSLGCHMSIIVYPIHRWNKKPLDDRQRRTAIIEELCHCLWSIKSESVVQDKVTEVFQYIEPGISKRQLYPGEFENAVQSAIKAYFDSIKT